MHFWECVFLENPLNYASIQIQNIDELIYLNLCYLAILNQSESTSMKGIIQWLTCWCSHCKMLPLTGCFSWHWLMLTILDAPDKSELWLLAGTPSTSLKLNSSQMHNYFPPVTLIVLLSHTKPYQTTTRRKTKSNLEMWMVHEKGGGLLYRLILGYGIN